MKTNVKAKAKVKIDAPVSKVWDALTKPELVKQYFFGTDLHTDWKEGGEIKFTGEWEGKSYEDKGTILTVVPNQLIRYTYWSSMSGIEDKPENYVNITYELEGDGDTTTLEITQENVPDEKMREHSEENWKKVLAGLKDLLEKDKPVRVA
ncbi:MAG TPA: SRPBCC family protein [Bacteroidia bacterium]|nr:SRPBCC family protein [Bacteroidia bacterium]